MFSARVEAALTFAGLRHAGQVRRDTGAPYLTHLVHVARILSRYGFDEDHEVTALLHDVLEDTCKTAEERTSVDGEIEARFGARVAEAVRALSEPKRGPDGARLRWGARKRAYIAQLSAAPALAQAVAAADKAHNLATLHLALDAQGDALWRHFTGGPRETAWFYREVLDVLRAGPIGGTALVTDLVDAATRLEARVGGREAPAA